MKNKMMRIASILMVAVLLTVCAVSGTFAKYVTKASIDDTARVAKFGVQLAIDGTLFDKAYLAADANTPAGDATTGLTVKSDDDALVVAPGTKSGDGMTFSIKGQPEVSVAVAIKLQAAEGDTEAATAAPKDIFLKAGTYRDWTTAEEKAFELKADYYPVVFTLVEKYGDDTYNVAGAAAAAGIAAANIVEDTSAKTVTITGSWADMQALFTKLSTAMSNLAPGYKFDNEFTLSWEWKFEELVDNVADPVVDAADTLLGNLAADGEETATGETTGTESATAATFKSQSKASALENPTFSAIDDASYNLTTGFYFEISVTQVD